MCRMIIATGQVDMPKIIESLKLMALDQTRDHEHNKKSGRGSWIHQDGWGIAYLENNKWKIIKSTSAIFNDEKTNEIKKIKTNLAILHARYSTKGNKTLENTHPFYAKERTLGEFIFAHNGTIHDAISHSPKFMPRGETDSEQLFFSLLTQFEKEMSPKAIRNHLNQFRNAGGGSNIILSTRSKSIIATHPNTTTPEYLRMVVWQNEQTTIVSSEELAHFTNETWHALEFGDVVELDHETQMIAVHSVSEIEQQQSL